MVDPSHPQLPRRERELLTILYRLGEGSVSDVRDAMQDPPSYSAVRALLGLLKDKGHVKHKKVGRKYVYAPAVAVSRAKRNAFRHLVRTFFDDSIERAVSFLLDAEARRLSDEDLARLEERISKAREKKGNDQ